MASRATKHAAHDAKRSLKKQSKAVHKPQPRIGTRPLARELDEKGTRGRMVEGAARLLAERGLQATSFSEVLELTSSPRGSVYHHFPRGKGQLVKAALDLTTAQMEELFKPAAGALAEEVTALFLHLWRSLLVRSRCRAGCAVVAVMIAADSPELLEHAAAIFRVWRRRLARLLVTGGIAPGDADRFATTLIAACEGAVVLSRGEQSLEPFELVASQLLGQARALSMK